eukprot:31065-Pelagococcus_subviridis.AAC.3
MGVLLITNDEGRRSVHSSRRGHAQPHALSLVVLAYPLRPVCSAVPAVPAAAPPAAVVPTTHQLPQSAQHAARALTHADAHLGPLRALKQIVHGDHLPPLPRREKHALVHDVRELRAGEPAGDSRDGLARRRLALSRLHAAQMHAEDLRATGVIRRADEDATREPAGAKQRGVQRLRAVRRREHEHAAGLVEAVHLHEHLVQGLVSFLVQTRASARADGVELVDENHRRRRLARLRE